MPVPMKPSSALPSTGLPDIRDGVRLNVDAAPAFAGAISISLWRPIELFHYVQPLFHRPHSCCPMIAFG